MIEIFENHYLNEKLHYKKSASGLDIYTIPKQGFSKTFVYFGVKFGGKDVAKIVDGQVKKWPEGTAHFLEHKLFESQEKDLFQKFNSRGASINAYTNASSTVYYFSCTEQLRENLDALLRMVQHLELTEEDVEREKSIITQEIAMYRDQADWQLYHRTLRALYHNHPIRRSVAGDELSISKIDVALLMAAYKTFYTPHNAFVLVVGDVVPKSIVEWVEQAMTVEFKNRGAKVETVAVSEPDSVKFDYVAYPFELSYSKLLVGFKDTNRPLKGKSLYRHSLVVRMMQELFFGRASELYNRLYQSGVVNATFGVDYLFDVDYGFSLIGGDNMDAEALLVAIKAYGLEVDHQTKEGDTKEWLEALQEQFDAVKSRALGRYLMSYNGLEFIGHHFVTHILKGINPLNYVDLIESVTLEEVLSVFAKHIVNAQPAIVQLQPIKP